MNKININSVLILNIINALVSVESVRVKPGYSESHNCQLSENLKDEIASYETAVRDITDYVLDGPFKGKTYDELSKFVDKFGARLSGSQVLEDSIDYMINITRGENINDVVTEEVEVPHWVRGAESAVMIEPRVKSMAVLGLGFSVSTPLEGITAEVIVVKNFAALASLDNDVVKDKIVLYDPVYTTYGETVVYRSEGATKAAEKGALASLIKSIAPFSINSPHTGMQHYGENVTTIPTAALTLEDADLIRRLYDRGEKIILHLTLINSLDTKMSRNTLIDLKGTENPEKLVIISGHIDSWDVGQGAMDDGGGMMISWAAPVILNRLKLTAKRTIRTILWTGEELGLVGARAYEEKHKFESDNINIIMESDEGTFAPTGLEVSASQEGKCIIAEILKLFSSINATTLTESKYPGSDITVIVAKGIPGASLLNKNERYFWFHHSDGDTMNVLDPHELDLCTAFWTSVAYIIADLTQDIPRET